MIDLYLILCFKYEQLLFMENATVLVVDDVSDNLFFISEVIGDEYRVLAAKSGSVALAILERNNIDIILLDVVMPDMDGYEVIKQLKSNPKSRDIPVIFLTAKSSVDDEKKGFLLGASDYISKPISPPILMARLKTHLINKRSKDFLKSKNKYLEHEVEKRAAQMSELQDVTIQAMASLAETRDEETGYHIKRTQLYVKLLAQELAKLPKYENELTPERINIFYKSAPLHDIGKVGIPDSILLKPGKLTENEFEIMKTHAVLGYSSINQAEQSAGAAHSFLEVAKEIALYHHEKWDGSGYPKGISGEEIPISARLMAVADVYDALISKRVYKEAMTHQQAINIIKDGKGKHFDPLLIDLFLDIEHQFFAISEKYHD